MRRYTLLFIILTLVLAACRIESNIGLDINEDGSATLTVEIGFDDEFLELMSSQGADFSTDDLVGDLVSGADGAVFERREGDMNYFGARTEIADLSTWEGDVDTAGFENFSYTSSDDGAKLVATIVSEDGGDLGGDFGFDPSQFTDDFISANLIVRMPGSVTSHNADEVRDGALVWNIGLTGSTDIEAESSFGGSGFPWLVVLLAVIVIAALVGAIVALVVSRKNAERQIAAIRAAQAAPTTPSDPTGDQGSVTDLAEESDNEASADDASDASEEE